MTAKEFYNKRVFKHQLKRAIKHDKQYFEDAIIELMDMYAQEQVKNLTIPVVMPRILHFTDENGTAVDLNAEGINAKLKRDGTFEYFRIFGFAGRKELTPVYGA